MFVSPWASGSMLRGTKRRTTLNHRTMLRACSLLAGAGIAGGCSTWLPRAQSWSSSFETFEDARTAIESLEPMKSDVATLRNIGISPTQQPNMLILTQADIMRRFISGIPLKRDDLDPGVRACLEAHDACRGWEFYGSRIVKARTGNFVADFTNFSRRTETTGWRFNALILLINDVVVYRAWGGQPRINEIEVNTNPLGPAQEMGPSIIIQP